MMLSRGCIETLEKKRLREIEEKISKTRSTLEGILPIFTQVDRKRRSLELELTQLEAERTKLLQGQLVMDFTKLEF